MGSRHLRLIPAILVVAAFLPLALAGLRPSGDAGPATATAAPRRIVSLCQASTRILCELGCAERIVAIAGRDPPAAVADRPSLGRGMGSVNVEAILGHRPDLVFCWKSQAEALRTRQVRVHVIDCQGLEGVHRLVQEVGDAVRLVTVMRQREAAVTAAVAGHDRPLVYYEAGGIGKTRGPGTLTHDLISLAGGRNAAADQPVPYPLLNGERLIALDPDVILVESSWGTTVETIRSRAGWEGLRAVRNGRVHAVPGLFTDWTPACMDGLEQFARWFHPVGSGDGSR